MALQSRILQHTWSDSTSARYLPLLASGAPTLEAPARPRVRHYEVGNTGGLVPLDARLEFSSTSVDSLLFDDQNTEPARAGADQLDFIRSTTRLSVTELARVFSVTRQTVHEWCQGGSLAPHNAQRLEKLTAAMTALLDAVRSVTVQDLRRSVRAGPSLLDTVRANGDVSATTRDLIETLTREAAQRSRLAARFAGRRPSALEPSDFGRPHLKDDD